MRWVVAELQETSETRFKAREGEFAGGSGDWDGEQRKGGGRASDSGFIGGTRCCRWKESRAWVNSVACLVEVTARVTFQSGCAPSASKGRKWARGRRKEGDDSADERDQERSEVEGATCAAGG